jgi:hypothetical protein
MGKRIILLIGLTAATAGPASAMQGFSVQIGVGGGFWDMKANSLATSLDSIGRPGDDRLTDSLSDGLALRFGMAYNILGFVAIDLGLMGHGWNLGGDDKGGSGFASLGVTVFPLHAWLPERDYDVYLSVAGGFSMIGGGHVDDNDNRGLRGGMAEFGLGACYYLADWVALGAEFRVGVPFYDTWIVDWDNDETYPLDMRPDGVLMGLYFVTSFHFDTR